MPATSAASPVTAPVAEAHRRLDFPQMARRRERPRRRVCRLHVGPAKLRITCRGNPRSDHAKAVYCTKIQRPRQFAAVRRKSSTAPAQPCSFQGTRTISPFTERWPRASHKYWQYSSTASVGSSFRPSSRTTSEFISVGRECGSRRSSRKHSQSGQVHSARAGDCFRCEPRKALVAAASPEFAELLETPRPRRLPHRT